MNYYLNIEKNFLQEFDFSSLDRKEMEVILYSIVLKEMNHIQSLMLKILDAERRCISIREFSENHPIYHQEYCIKEQNNLEDELYQYLRLIDKTLLSFIEKQTLSDPYLKIMNIMQKRAAREGFSL